MTEDEQVPEKYGLSWGTTKRSWCITILTKDNMCYLSPEGTVEELKRLDSEIAMLKTKLQELSEENND